MTAPLSYQKKGALWRAYKQRPTASYVANTCGVSWHTANKYIRELNFPQRLANLHALANTMVDKDQATDLVEELKTVANVKTLVSDDLIEAYKNKELRIAPLSTADYDRLVRLERYLRGEPESRTQQAFTLEFLEKEPVDEEQRDRKDRPAKEARSIT